MIRIVVFILLLFEWSATPIACEFRRKNTTDILEKLRFYMNGSDEIYAYIVPTEDAHQVNFLELNICWNARVKNLGTRCWIVRQNSLKKIYLNCLCRANTWQSEIKDGRLYQALMGAPEL